MKIATLRVIGSFCTSPWNTATPPGFEKVQAARNGEDGSSQFYLARLSGLVPPIDWTGEVALKGKQVKETKTLKGFIPAAVRQYTIANLSGLLVILNRTLRLARASQSLG